MVKVPEKIENIINDFIKGIYEILGEHLKKIILYGSYARGDYNEGSDVDIMILTDLDDNELEDTEYKIWDYAYDVEWNYDFKIHLSVSLNNVEKYNQRISFVPFYKNVQTEGVILNG